MARRTSKLTAKQEEYVDAVLTGKPVGLVTTNTAAMHKSEKVQEEIARARAEISSLTTLTRLDVIEGLMDGINTARVMSDGGNMIRGWTEIAKILGHYAPEVKNIILNTNQDRIRSKLESLSDKELIEVIEGQAREVHGSAEEG